MTGSSAPVQAGDMVAGKYRVDRVIGRGGMGVVVAATHLQLEQQVALKFMLPEVLGDREAVERFHREARAAARLKSEHVARIIDVGVLESGPLYIVMEYLDGTDLASVVSRVGSLPVAQIADYIVQALDALAEAHVVGIVHRDLKPGNLFLSRRADGSALVKVLDFGISKAGPTVADTALTRTQAVIGSPVYMSPEHMRASRMVDARSDIWSLGVILYELASGRVPFNADAFSTLVLQVAMDPPPPLASSLSIPDGFESVVCRCLEKDPARRFQNVAELAVALAPFAPTSAWTTVERIRNLIGRQMAPAPASPPVRVSAAPATPPPTPAHTTPLPPSYTPSPSSSQPGASWQTGARARRSRRTAGIVAVVFVIAAAVGALLAALQGGGEDDDGAGSPVATPPTEPAQGAGKGPPSSPVQVATPPAAPPTVAPPAVRQGAGAESAPADAAPEAAPAERAPESAPTDAPKSTRRPRPNRPRPPVKPTPEPDDPLATPE